MGLVGSRGILPVADFLRAVRAGEGGAAWWDVPTLLWINSSDAAVRTLWIAGALAALVAIFTKWQRTALAVCLLLWLSVCLGGQEFLSFQWDILLVEAGFLALFADATPVRVVLFRWLIFRLMFFSGAVKLLSHDPTWRGLTALAVHYETQPLPTPIAWYLYQLPLWFHKASTAIVLLVELAVPFLFFAPRRFRHVGAWITIALQVLILLTGNYTFFNLLTIILTFWLFLDWEKPPVPSRIHRGVSVAIGVLVGTLSGMTCLSLFSVDLPPGGAELLHAAGPFRIVNSYGLFADMTISRPEIVVEGSADGKTWLAYEFPYKPGDLRRAPPVVAPHQPRLDWQMWFAALGSYQQNRWFVNFMVRLLQGEPSVLRLVRYNPFPAGPPKFVRARLYVYHFTHRGQQGWWTREDSGLYFPAAGL